MLKSQSFRTNVNVTVLLVDDEIKLLEALGKYLESQNICVAMATSTKEALAILQDKVPDIFIVDVIMPDQTGYDFIQQLKENKRFAMTPFIFLTAKGMIKDRIKGYRLGCRAYITKPFDPEELISVINNIISETKDISTIRHIRDEIRKIRLLLENKNTSYVQLTRKEELVLLEIIEGKSNKDIGETMKISTRNVEKYVSKLLSKTNTKNRTDLVKFAFKFYKFLRANDENRTRE